MGGLEQGVRKGWAFWENLVKVVENGNGGKKWWRW
jgi:hypothetical protein